MEKAMAGYRSSGVMGKNKTLLLMPKLQFSFTHYSNLHHSITSSTYPVDPIEKRLTLCCRQPLTVLG